ncbi:phage recombination protein Bet [Brevirhabdus pacifica]|uniref:Phage recombination protein Bet n=1 Tax=Brevirhabdus pacifica TaxID=1267768 RepID=A0A1U7DFE6_9RHOB|nr:phage recombination protein Bet [Brevirhabdus pacifica]APX88681.1 phage recombination protein Bet [Brevirhabdus pacifica]OWU79946.1 recombinase [Loktanella sp. 22II-4b]PJJ86813.1 phage recombination protein Bet [Brevirhabdus pacifica]
MSNAVTLSGYTPAQIRTIKQTVAKDTNETEFDLFMEACRSYGLDPFRKQIHAVVYSKDRPDRRKMSIIVSRDGLRVLAQRCRDYRPASEPAQIVHDEALAGPTNPKGIVSATVRLWKQDNRGEWYPVIGEAYWDEFAPVMDEWAFDKEAGKRQPTGRKTLDQSGNWAKMPIVMLTKCAESQALRAGWPDQFGNIYSEEEMERLKTDTTASEALHELEQAEREARVGGAGILMVFDDTMKLEKVPMGMVHDRCADFLRTATPEEAHVFRVRNEHALRDFWVHDKGAALEIKKLIEGKEADFKPGQAA